MSQATVYKLRHTPGTKPARFPWVARGTLLTGQPFRNWFHTQENALAYARRMTRTVQLELPTEGIAHPSAYNSDGEITFADSWLNQITATQPTYLHIVLRFLAAYYAYNVDNGFNPHGYRPPAPNASVGLYQTIPSTF